MYKHTFKECLYIGPMKSETVADRILIVVRAAEVPERKIRSTLAKACGVSPQAVKEWVEGKTKNIAHANLIAISKKWGVSLDWLISGKGARHVNKSSLGQAMLGKVGPTGHSIIPDVQKDVVLGLGSEPNPKDEARALLSSLPDHEKMALIEDLTELLPIEDAAKAAVMFSARVLRDLGEPGA